MLIQKGYFSSFSLGEADRQLPSLINVLIKYKGSTPTLRRLMGEKYLLPPQVAFLMSDISNMAPLVAGTA